MNRLAPLALLAALPGNAHAADECPASLVFRVPGLSAPDVEAANRYAGCMSVPSLPIAAQLAGKLSQCRNGRPAAPSDKLGRALNWVDHIASEFAACETRLEIQKK